jgi:DNA-binding protein HU-beta
VVKIVFSLLNSTSMEVLKMNFAELVDVVAATTKQTKTATRTVIKEALDTIQKDVKKGNRVSIVGFGAFFKAHRNARTGRNPLTGERLQIRKTDVPRFKAGKSFREAVRRSK